MSELTFFKKIRGEKFYSGLLAPDITEALMSGMGGMLIVGLLYLLHDELKVFPSFIVPFGASAVLVFAAPAAPFSQPRNVILGHLIAALMGIVAYSLLPTSTLWALLLANGAAIFLMVLLKAVHPPAGATALLPVLSQISDMTWLLQPVLAGSAIIVLMGMLYNNLYKKRRYPVYWV